MKPLIVYQSRTGNTRRIVHTIASTLGADILPVENARWDSFKDRTLVGFGSGIYWIRVDEKIYELLPNLPSRCRAFMFVTSSMGFPFMLRLYWYFIQKRFDRFGINLVGRWDSRGHDKHPLFK